jgi:hypothetical protein
VVTFHKVYQYVGCVAVVGLHLQDTVDKVLNQLIVVVVAVKAEQVAQE